MPMSHVLVHVAGDTLLRGSRKLYEVRSPRGNPVRLRASSTVLPVSIEALGRGKVELSKLRVIVLLPHSLITHAREFWRLPRRGEGSRIGSWPRLGGSRENSRGYSLRTWRTMKGYRRT